MGGKAQAGASVAAATIYSAGRAVDTALSWAQAAAIAGIQATVMYSLLDKQKGHYDAISHKQLQYVEAAINQYILDLNNNIIPLFADAYPEVPKAAEFEAPDPTLIQYQQMVDNIANATKTDEYVRLTNGFHRQGYEARAEMLSPGFMVSLRKASVQIGELIDGRLPQGDLVELLTDIQEQACLTGRVGAVRKTTIRKLGLTQLRVQQLGRDELA